MRFALTDEQEMLREAVRGALEREAPPWRVREWAEGDDPRAGTDLAARHGWLGIGTPEEEDGQGGGLVELALVVEELARAAAPATLLGHAGLALPLLRACSPGRDVTELTSGERLATVVVCARKMPGAGAGAVTVGDGGLWGEVPFVLGAPEADLLLVPADDDRLHLVEREAPGATVEASATVDLTRRWGDVRLEGAPGEPLSSGTAAMITALAPRVAALVAADSLGAAERMLEATVEHARQRVQFDRPIGSFQAVKHTAADMLVDVEAARSAAYFAAWSVEVEQPDAALHASAAKAFCSEAGARTADRALALHGAIGFTWEHNLHLHLKRARANVGLFAGPATHRERVAALLALEPAAAVAAPPGA